MSIPIQACPVTLQPWQGYYNGWLFGSGTPYNILEVSKGFDMVALGSQDSQYPRQTGEIIGLDVAKGRDLDLHFWVAPVGQNPAPGGLMKIMEQAVRVGGYVEEPLWLYIPPWPILAFMVRARKRSFPLDVNFSTAGLIKPSLSFHATDPIGYANLKTADLTAPTANLLTGEDATFVGGVGSWTGTNVTLSNTTSETLGNSSSLEIVPVTNADPASISTAQGTSSAYQVSGLAGQQVTVMGSMRSEGPSFPPATLAAPTVTTEGTTGSTTYDYSFSASILGTIEASSTGSTTTGNATLSSTDYNLVAWTAVPLPAGSSGNLVYDSYLSQAIATVGPTWDTTGLNIGTVAGDWDSLNPGTDSAEWVNYGSGANPGYNGGPLTQLIDVVPGSTITVAGIITVPSGTGSPPNFYGISICSTSSTPTSLNNLQAATASSVGTNSVSASYTVPSGTTQVRIMAYNFNSSIPSGSSVSWSYISLIEGPAPANQVFDSNLSQALAANNPTWSTSSVTIGTADGDFNVQNAGTDQAEWVIYGTGASVGRQTVDTLTIAATSSATYTAAGVADATNATAGSLILYVYDQAGNFLGSLTQPAGANGLVSATVTALSTSTGVVLEVGTGGMTVAAGATVSWSEIQLTQTSSVQPYEPGIEPQAGPLWTYDVYRANALIGSTTALAFEDTGQTAGPTGGTSTFQLGVEFYDLAGNSLSTVQSPVFSDSQGFWSFVSFGTNVPSTAATLAVNVTTDALNGTHYLSDVGVFAMSPSANLAPDTSTLNTWTLSSGFGIAASALGGNEITFDGSGSSSSSSQALYLEAQKEYVISSYLDASNATAGSISMEIAGYSTSQNFGNTGTVSATFTATNTGMYQVIYNTSSLTVGSGLKVSFAQPQVEVGSTPSTYTPGQNWFLGAGTGGLIYPVTYPVVYQTQSKKFVAQNNGNWPVYPRVTMTGPLNLPTLTVGSQSFALDNNQNPTIPEGYQVVIDMQTHAVIYSAIGQTEGTNYLSWVTNSSNWLTIPVGGADVEFASGAQDTGSCIFESADGWFM
jgi:hypothetical protein